MLCGEPLSSQIARCRDQEDSVMDMATSAWRRSSWCSTSSCVEVAQVNGAVAVRDSKTADGAVLLYTPEEWHAFIAGVKAGEFDNHSE